MRIVVNDIAASKGGALTVLKDFYQKIRENGDQNEWYFLLGDRYVEETDNIHVLLFPEIKRDRKKKLLFDFVTGRKIINALNPDEVISLQNIITFGVKAPQTVLIHQAIPFQKTKRFSFFKKNERKLAVYQHLIGRVIKLSARKADKVIVQTEWMKEAVALEAGISEEKIQNILPATEDLSAYKGTVPSDKTTFFYPTAAAVYKNNDCIYRACEILRSRGIKDFTVRLTIKTPENFADPNIQFVGRLPREEVLKMYSGSTLLFPSYIETFGYPLAEARQIGAQILASDCAFSHEVLKGYDKVDYFDPFKPEQLADLMERVIKA